MDAKNIKDPDFAVYVLLSHLKKVMHSLVEVCTL